ncbi:MAG: hypothetical protein QNJ68_04280 [Microcoleaceae cyanobacterium MO_207.B10]|nr:hypothetical protein [Microcoleaceae cyanobacterium MO_207.B10]
MTRPNPYKYLVVVHSNGIGSVEGVGSVGRVGSVGKNIYSHHYYAGVPKYFSYSYM